jgi:hypothetical protein
LLDHPISDFPGDPTSPTGTIGQLDLSGGGRAVASHLHLCQHQADGTDPYDSCPENVQTASESTVSKPPYHKDSDRRESLDDRSLHRRDLKQDRSSSRVPVESI